MPIHDISCQSCNTILRDISFRQDQYKDMVIHGIKCPDCENDTFIVYWGSGKAPFGSVAPSTPEEKFRKSKTIGEFWDRSGLKIGSEQNKKAGVDRVNRMRNNANKNR
jgi:hypothetical protein